MSVHYCYQCGTKLTDADRFCFKCGASAMPVEPVEEPVQVAYNQGQSYQQEPVQNALNQGQSYQEEPVQPAFNQGQSYREEPAQNAFNQGQSYQEEPVQAAYNQGQSYQEEPVQNVNNQGQYYQEVPVQVEPEQVYTPPVQQWQQEEVSAAPKKKVLPRRKGGVIFGSIMICILATVLLLVTVLGITLRSGLEKDNLVSTLERVDLDEIPAEDLVDDADDRALAKWICNTLNEKIPETLNIADDRWDDLTTKDLEALISETSLREFLAESVEDIVDELLLDDGEFSIDVDDIAEFLEENSRYLERNFPLSLSYGNQYIAAEQILEVAGTDEIKLPDMGEAVEGAQGVTSFVFSTVGVILAFVVIAGLIVLLFLVNRKTPLGAIHDMGVVMQIASGIPLVLMGVARILAYFFAGENGIVYLVGVLGGGILEGGLILNAAIFGAGLIFLLINSIGRAVQKRRLA
jgi:hypothetical protein